jgi:hypothetical protein
METQYQGNTHFNAAEFIEELIEEERISRKKEVKVMEECNCNSEDDIHIDIQNKLRDEETDSRKKTCQEKKLQLIKDQEDNKVEFARRTKEKSEVDSKKEDFKRANANEISKHSFKKLNKRE